MSALNYVYAFTIGLGFGLTLGPYKDNAGRLFLIATAVYTVVSWLIRRRERREKRI